jgi:pimeloyl-[acyl-carrier protein] methyl ester esterase
MHKSEILAFHGWGFEASCWQGWEQEFGEHISFETFERGYFGKAKHTPIFMAKDTFKIIMTHSFGLHFCPENLFKEADMLVIFNGFIEFHPVAAQFKRRSKLVIKQMINELKGKPAKVLRDFYENTYKPQMPQPLPESKPDKELLLKDLKMLNTHTLKVSLLKSIHKICILHAFEDAIVHRRKGRSLYDSLNEKAKYFEIKNAGHALPFTHKEQCLQFIEPEFNDLIST